MVKAAASMACPECGGSMERGFLLDGRYQAEWMKGLHEKGLWTSTKFRGKERRRVESWRCVGCGFLKSYARDMSS
jgi:predicted RNA-binding Zn-ribbon protein involved in translation (DUF1610 family)